MKLNDKLHIAWKRIKVDRSTDFIIGDFEYEVFDYYKKDLIGNLEEKIVKQEEYVPQPLRSIRVPKTSYTTRPGAVPDLFDRIYYQYLVDEIADEIEDNLIPISENVVHSYRYIKKRDAANMFLKSQANYSTFEQRTMELAEGHKFIVVTDISSYFERIYHHELENTIRALGASADIVDKLMSLLRKWRRGNSYSIPQGIWPSDYLGNVYLDPIDKLMFRKGINYCRFVDDIRIGVNSYKEAQSILLLLEEKLSSLGLTLNDAKTKIISNDEVESNLFPQKKRIEEIKKDIKWERLLSSFNPYDDSEQLEDDDEYVDLTSIRELFREQLELEHPIPSIARFCLKHLKKFSDNDILDDVLENLDKLVVVTPQVVGYLNTIYQNDDIFVKMEISSRLSETFKDKLWSYDWQIMWYLHLMNKFNDLESDEVNAVRSLLINRTRELHDAVLVNGLLFLGKHGDNADLEWILGLFDNYSLWVKNAIIFSLRNLTKTKRNHFYSYCVGQNLLIDKIIEYVKLKY